MVVTPLPNEAEPSPEIDAVVVPLLFLIFSVPAWLLAPTVTVESNVPVVPAIVLGVVAPTVPLMLMLAVPLAFVRTIADGVPRSPLTSASVPDASGNAMFRLSVGACEMAVVRVPSKRLNVLRVWM